MSVDASLTHQLCLHHKENIMKVWFSLRASVWSWERGNHIGSKNLSEKHLNLQVRTKQTASVFELILHAVSGCTLLNQVFDLKQRNSLSFITSEIILQ